VQLHSLSFPLVGNLSGLFGRAKKDTGQAGMTARETNGPFLVAFLGGLFLVMLASVFSSGTEAATEQWKYLGGNDKGDRFFYDAASVIYASQDLRQVWIKELSNEPERRLMEINCSYKIIRDRQVISEGKSKVPRRPVKLPSEWRAMEKDPVTKELHKVLCK
jgi:hypothetical protein